MCAGPALATGNARTGSSSARRRASTSGNSGTRDLSVGEAVGPLVLLVRHHVELLQALGPARVRAEDPWAGVREVVALLDRLVEKRFGLVREEAIGVEPELARTYVEECQENRRVAPVRPAALERERGEPEADTIGVAIAHGCLRGLLCHPVEDACLPAGQSGVHRGPFLGARRPEGIDGGYELVSLTLLGHGPAHSSRRPGRDGRVAPPGPCRSGRRGRCGLRLARRAGPGHLHA